MRFQRAPAATAESVEGITRRPFFLGLLLVALISSLVFAAIAVEVERGRSVPTDSAVLRQLRRGEHLNALRDVVGALGVLGGAAGVAAIAALAFVILLLVRRPRAAAFFAGSVAFAALSPLLKGIFARLPPALDHPSPGEAGFFPSGHAMGSMALAAAFLVLVWDTRFRILAAGVAGFLVIAIGLSAVYDGGHWPSDVVGGWALSLAWVAGLRCLTAWPGTRRRARPRRHEHREPNRRSIIER